MTIRDHLGLTALDVAEKADHEECMIVLRAAADKIEAQRVETLTILQDACSQGDLPAVKSILSALDPASVQNLINFAPGGANTLFFKGQCTGKCTGRQLNWKLCSQENLKATLNMSRGWKKEIVFRYFYF